MMSYHEFPFLLRQSGRLGSLDVATFWNLALCLHINSGLEWSISVLAFKSYTFSLWTPLTTQMPPLILLPDVLILF